MAGLRDEIAAVPDGRSLKVCQFTKILRKLDAEDAQALDEMVLDPAVSIGALLAVLERRGVVVARFHLDHHRRGDCVSCKHRRAG